MKKLLLSVLLLTSIFSYGQQECGPVANAGNDTTIILPVREVTLRGSGSAPFGTIVSYQWWKVSGPSYGAMTAQDAATNTVTWMSQGVYVFVLTVTDSQGATDTDSVKVTINAATPPPPPPVECVAKIYPNPVTTVLNIDITCFKHTGPVSFPFYNSQKQRIGNITTLTYNMYRWPAGTYYISIFNKMYTIIKQ
jgi:hypothetical protein